MRQLIKSDIKSNAIKIPSKAAEAFNIDMYVFKRKNIDTQHEETVCIIQFEDKGYKRQTENIHLCCPDLSDLHKVKGYSSKLSTAVSCRDEAGEKITTCYKDLRQFLKNEKDKIPVRSYYDLGYGWTHDPAENKVRFYGASIVGIDNIVLDDHEHHLKKAGQVDKTVNLCNEIMRDKPSTQFLFAASLAAPIFGALDLKSLIINICGKSSQGKTTISLLGTSFWSAPSDPNLATTWNNTENSIAVRLNNIEGVPFLIDDTSQGEKKDITQLVYNLEGGVSRGRLNRTFRLDNVATWHTAIFSASEDSVYERTEREKLGLLRRLVEVPVNQGDLIDDERQSALIHSIISRNYGEVGTSFVEGLFKSGLVDDSFANLHELLAAEQKHLVAQIPTEGGIAKGLAEKLAVIMLAAKLGQKIVLDFELQKLEHYINNIARGAAQKAEKAMVQPQDFDSCYQEVCAYAKANLGERYETELEYRIPVSVFNYLERSLGYGFQELRKLFAKYGVCSFTEGSLDNTARIKSKEGKSTSQKVVVVAKVQL